LVSHVGPRRLGEARNGESLFGGYSFHFARLKSSEDGWW
jgi:hypothetical protein